MFNFRYLVLFLVLGGFPGIDVYAKRERGNYDYSGNPNWPKLSAFLDNNNPIALDNCNGMYQSPIRLDIENITSQLEGTIRHKNFAVRAQSITLRNNGYTANFRFQYNRGRQPTIVSETGRRYIFESIHFHWGQNNSIGSEHELNDRFFPMEIHILFHDSRYPNVEAAAADPNLNIIVLTFFFEITTEDVPLRPMTLISRLLSHIEQADSVYNLAENEFFEVHDFFRNGNNLDIYTYNGSLTTPPCSETVRWFFPSTILKVNNQIMNRFRRLRDREGRNILNNFRPLQPINGREIQIIKRENIQYIPMARN